MVGVDKNVKKLLRSIDRISLDDLSAPSTYDFIRYSKNPLLDSADEAPVLENHPSVTEAFALNFSRPPEHFRNQLEDIIQSSGDIGTNIDSWYRGVADEIAISSIDAGRVAKRMRGTTGFVLMSDINEELNEEEFKESSGIPQYFLGNSELDSKYYVFEGFVDGQRDIKIAAMTEDETAIAWYVGRTLEEFDIDDEFKEAYNDRVEAHVLENYPERF